MMRTGDVVQTPIGSDQVPTELVELKERIRGQSPMVRAELEPLIDEVMEHALFRSRVMMIARDALHQFRVDMAALRLDLEATQREARSH